MSACGAGRFAPSPTSDLHLGNLRTALLAWLFARSTHRRFLLRIEDLDTLRVRSAPGTAARQIDDLISLGLDFDGETRWQSQRLESYQRAIDRLDTYACFCTRREIAEAASAPHSSGLRPYPGTCRDLTEAERAKRAQTRRPAVRVRAREAVSVITDAFAGQVSAVVDDFVVMRNDGIPAYNLAVVVDDLDAGIDQVVRGDDLLDSSPRQAWLAGQLGGVAPGYAHVPLAVNSDQVRLAKRDGAVSLTELAQAGVTTSQVLGRIAESLGLTTRNEPVSLDLLLDRFDPDAVPRQPWVVETDYCW
jgi:glutamyl-tRNA synthetase